LPPITDPDVLAFENNPNASDTARLTTEMKAALKCLTDGATTLGCTPAPSVGSAFRPPAYNQHLINVWKKWVNELMEDENPACANLKAKIQGHFQRHKLLISQPPVPNSRHTRGLAVDVTINLPPANIKILAKGCGLIRPKPVDDPVHFQFP
jgi:D-alanyl-D-alanine dipeptidase